MKIIHTDEIIKNIKEMCIEANYFLSQDVKEKINAAGENETYPLGKQILTQLKENLEIAQTEEIPICQDV